jgi:hypothetical protein
MSNRCEHVYKEFGWKRIRDIRVQEKIIIQNLKVILDLKCEKCGKIKKENTRIKNKEDEK